MKMNKLHRDTYEYYSNKNNNNKKQQRNCINGEINYYKNKYYICY